MSQKLKNIIVSACFTNESIHQGANTFFGSLKISFNPSDRPFPEMVITTASVSNLGDRSKLAYTLSY